nr:PLP-dependent aminotransferase family protein [Enterococcus cecorum]
MYQLNSESNLPYYQQIIHELIEAIQSGELLPEERLPAERKLAQIYGVNRSTVGRALDELVSLGWLERQQGSGTYISATRIANRKSPQLPWKNLLARPIFVEDPYLAELKTKRNEKDCIDLSSGDLPLSLIQNFNIPSLSWEQVLKMQADLPDSGEIHLRQALVNHLKNQYQLSLSAEELLITSGSTQGMSLIFDTLLKPGDVVATENPSFLFSLPWIASNQVELLGIDMDSEGMIVEKLEQQILQRRIKLIYLNPDFQNPTGRLMSLERRQQILTICKKYQIPIVEDDAYGELNFKRPLPRLKSLANEQVIYLGSLSKIFSPHIKIGWVAAPKSLLSSIIETKIQSERTTDLFSQIIAQNALSASDYVVKQTHLLHFLAQRQAEILQVFSEFNEYWQVEKTTGGLYLYCTWKHQKLHRKDWQIFLNQNLLVAPSFLYCNQCQSMRLNYAHLATYPLEEFKQRLAHCTAALLAKR